MFVHGLVVRNVPVRGYERLVVVYRPLHTSAASLVVQSLQVACRLLIIRLRTGVATEKQWYQHLSMLEYSNQRKAHNYMGLKLTDFYAFCKTTSDARDSACWSNYDSCSGRVSGKILSAKTKSLRGRLTNKTHVDSCQTVSLADVSSSQLPDKKPILALNGIHYIFCVCKWLAYISGKVCLLELVTHVNYVSTNWLCLAYVKRLASSQRACLWSAYWHMNSWTDQCHV